MGEYFPNIPDLQLSQMGDVQEDPTLYVAEEVFHYFPVDYLWGKSQGDWGYHPLGLALDFSGLEYGNGPDDPGPMNKQLCENISQYLWINRFRLQVRTIIWNRRIISTNHDGYAYNQWTTYRRNDIDPHTDHVHVDFYDKPYTPPAKEIEMHDTVDHFLEPIQQPYYPDEQTNLTRMIVWNHSRIKKMEQTIAENHKEIMEKLEKLKNDSEMGEN